MKGIKRVSNLYFLNFCSKGIKEAAIETYLGSVSGMRNFRVFLRGTRGERLFAFWMDAERFRRKVAPKNRRFVYREIQVT